ncbi:hypothetical protein CVT24_008556, partial [Panaeolus cyanescens]
THTCRAKQRPILDIEDDQSLLKLASSSKAFNHLALHTYFSRHGLDTNNIVIKPTPNQSSSTTTNVYLRALLISLDASGKDVNSLTYRYNCYDSISAIAEQILGVSRLIRRLGSIRELRLRSYVPFRFFSNAIDKANADLLDATFHKNPQELYLASFGALINGIGLKNQEMIEERGTPLQSLEHPHLFDTKSSRQPNRDTELRRLRFDDFTSIFRQFSFNMVRLERFKLLTHLELANIISCEEQDFSTSLLDAEFPCLTHLIIDLCHRGEQRILFDFVGRHGGITTLSFLLCDMYRRVEPLPVANLDSPPVLPKLQQLRVTPCYIPHFFSSTSSLVSIKKVILDSDITMYRYRGENAYFFQALTALQSCPNRIDLSTTPKEFRNWLGSVNSNPSFLPKPSLSCVRSLLFSYRHVDFQDVEITELPTWFGPFPDLEEVQLEVLTHNTRPDSFEFHDSKWNKKTSRAVAEQIKAACPTIQKFSVVQGQAKALSWGFDGGNAVSVS